MKQFLLFAWNSDERAGGWADFVGSFDSAEEAKTHYVKNIKGAEWKDLYDIVDTHAGDDGLVVDI